MSRIRGVSRWKFSGTWRAQITHNRKHTDLGTFSDEWAAEAAVSSARDALQECKSREEEMDVIRALKLRWKRPRGRPPKGGGA